MTDDDLNAKIPSGLHEEIHWSDNGDPDVQRRRDELLTWTTYGLFIGDSAAPATDAELRALGLVKKRRWVGEWEVVDD